MSSAAQNLARFLAAHKRVAKVEVAQALGSTPREQGAWMLVAADAIFGTIGGGQLEYIAIDEARRRLRSDPPHKGEGGALSIALGPEIGQCCGGRVELSIELLDDASRKELIETAKTEEQTQPQVHLFGGGHVGQALAVALALLPVRTIVVETRAEALLGMPADVETRLTPVPEETVRAASPGSIFVVLTHDHALDFLIVAEALKRGDAAYVGMIGSATKKATFRSWFLKTAGGSEAEFTRLVTPIGGAEIRDKRPAVIAALAAAEIMTAVSRNSAAFVDPKIEKAGAYQIF